MEELLKVEDLNVVYTSGKTTAHALNGISFSLGRKETLGLVGETGAGKTTTALSIMRLLPERTGKKRSGTITFDGKELDTLSETAMQAVRGGRISMIFQDPMTSLNPVMKIGDQIKEALVLHNTENRTPDEVEARMEEILRLVGIGADRKNDYPHQFSGGMKQRVVIAIALSCSPELLIADEPTTALDVTIQAQVLEMMAKLKETLDMSMIMITHDLGVIAKVCDKVAVMYAGEIVEYGTLEDIFKGKVHHPYTEGLFGAIPNLEDESDRLHPIEGMLPDPTNLPQGCKFHPRCTKCTAKCKTELPGNWVDGTHGIRCHLMEKEAGYEAG